MKYKTVIEVVCEAADRDEAFNTAGEYLRGNVDPGVTMRFSTTTLGTYRLMKFGFICLAIFLLVSVFFVKDAPAFFR